MSNFVKVARVGDIPPGQATIVEAEGRSLALFNVGGAFYATDNECLHRGGPLGEGFLEEKKVTCPWHGWRYDVATGQAEMDPSMKLNTYPVKVEGEEILVGL